MRDRYYILRGKKIVSLIRNSKNLMTWGRFMESGADNRRVALTVVGRKNVSTVFLGLDHNYGGGKPLLFETMVFPETDVMERYHTWDEAVKGHNKIVAELKK